MRIQWSWIMALLTFILVILFRFRMHLHWLTAWFVAVNITTFLLFGIDKLAAMRQWPRVRETVLHLFALVGGSPAALAAQSILHHKVSKRSFVLVYWLIVIVQAALLYVVMYTDLLKETLL